MHQRCSEISGIREQLTERQHKLPKDETDDEGYIRLDDWEMKPEVQSEVAKAWETVATDNIKELGDIDGYWDDFYHMFGFGYDNVDYGEDVEI